MAEQDDVMTPAPDVWYVSAAPTANGNIGGQLLQREPAEQSLYQIQINPDNPGQAALLPAPGADARLLAAFDEALLRAFSTSRLPGRDEAFLTVEKPTLLERVGDNWKITEMGRVGFSATAPAQQVQAAEAGESLTTGQAQIAPQPVLGDEEVAPTLGVAAADDKAIAALAPDELPAGPAEQPSKAPQAQATAVGEGREAPTAGPAIDATVAVPVGELHITWQQKGDEVAPLLEMRAYLDQLREAGVAVGALQFERNPAGKLTGSFAVSYDPESNKLGQLEATLQGFRQVGHGVAVVEKPEQAAARRQEVGYDDGYEPPRSKQVRQAFGAGQWDALSAQLAAVPRHALTVPEQEQQAAAEQRVQQLAQQQGKTTEQVLRDAKSIFDIDTSGNPASAFLKNFYAHLNGGPKTRQHLEVDYEQTRQDLQARLLRKAGTAQAEVMPDQASDDAPTVRAVAVADPSKPAPAPSAPPFQASDVPQQVLASLGLTLQTLEQSGQLDRLLSGRQTDLLAMQVTGRPDQDPVRFEGKMVLRREADGTATLKMELPQARLVIPNEIGGLPFTPEQRQRLETEGNAGLLRGLKDEQGRAYNGYVAVDKAMNKVVILPEDKVTLHDTIAGVKLTPEQSHDLREGKVVALAGMASGDGGRQFDGTVQVNAAKACIEVRPAAHELIQHEAPQVQQAVPAVTKTVVASPAKEQTTQVKTRGLRH